MEREFPPIIENLKAAPTVTKDGFGIWTATLPEESVNKYTLYPLKSTVGGVIVVPVFTIKVKLFVPPPPLPIVANIWYRFVVPEFMVPAENVIAETLFAFADPEIVNPLIDGEDASANTGLFALFVFSIFPDVMSVATVCALIELTMLDAKFENVIFTLE